MREIIRFMTNVPVEVTLRQGAGKQVEGRYGPQMMYTLADERVMYVPPIVADRIRELDIGPNEPFEVCKAELREGNRRWIEWRVQRIEESSKPMATPQEPEVEVTAANQKTEHYTSKPNGSSNGNGTSNGNTRFTAAADGALLPVPVTGRAVTAMETALNAAAEIAHRVESRAALNNNHAVQFTHEDVGHWPDDLHSGHAGRERAMGRVEVLAREFSPRYFDEFASEQLFEIRQNLNIVLENRSNPQGSTELIPLRPAELMRLGEGSMRPAAIEPLGAVLSPTQVRTFLDCSAKWWFKYGVGLPEPKSSWLAFGLAVHSALEVNFRYKLINGEDLERAQVIMAFRDAWREQIGETVFREDEDPRAMERTGERLLGEYMRDVAPQIRPAAVELEAQGEIAGVTVCGRVDLLDMEGRVIDTKTASRRPAGVSPDYAFQLATYRQITPGASGEARLDTMVKTNLPYIVAHSYHVGEQDLRATTTLFPLVQEGIRTGLYYPNRQSMLCSRRYCPYWRECEAEFGGTVRDA